ncbi:MAG: DUF3800 domain-containing protein [Thermoflexales bacterium]|nr:DUF3800 domain-containing protein [Thermoflexales bacterium]
MLTLTFAGDEAGDVSFSFDKGASRYFAVVAIATDKPDTLRERLADLRQSSGLPHEYEFKFNRLSSAALRRRVFASLGTADFEAWAVIVDKPALSDPFKVMRGMDVYVYFLTELIQLIPAEKRDGATLILDEFGSATQLRSELRRFMLARGIPRHFKRILAKRSRSEPLIQVADLMAGAILRRDARRDGEAYEYVESKLKRVLEFRS